MDFLLNLLNSFVVFHINAFYSILYFLKNNFFFFFVLFAIGYMTVLELRIDDSKFVNDERRII